MKVARLVIYPELILFMSRGIYEVVADPLPDDVRAINTVIDPQTGAINLFVESDSFEDVPEGAVPPELSPFTIRTMIRHASGTA